MAQNVVKSYNAFRVNEGLLLKVVEAIKSAETMARRSGVLRSFEVSYHGHRQDLVLGRISLVPAKLADNWEDFPSALLYGAVVKTFKGEDIADLYHAKIGESEYDNYDHVDMQAIKDQLFKDANNVYRTLVVFEPVWSGSRDIVCFHFMRNDALLMQAVRHAIYNVYYDPALSNGFEAMSQDFGALNHEVIDVTPKLNFPFLAENILKEYPVLVPSDEAEGVNPLKEYPQFTTAFADGVKLAGARRPKTVLAADNVGDVAEEMLEPGELSVIDALSQDLAAIVDNVTEPIEEASVDRLSESDLIGNDPVALKKRLMDAKDVLSKELAPRFKRNNLDLAGKRMLSDDGKIALQWVNDGSTSVGAVKVVKASAKTAETIDGTDATGLRNKPDYGEPGSYTYDANEASIANTKDEKTAADHQTTYAGWKSTIKKQHPEAHFEGDKDICQAFATKGGRGVGEWDGDKGTIYKSAVAKQTRRKVLAKDGSFLLEATSKKGKVAFIAVSRSGHVEKPRFKQGHISFAQPVKFSNSFRIACEKFLLNVKKNAGSKKADVPLTLDEIWNQVTEDLGGAPEVPVKMPSDVLETPSEEKAEDKQEPSDNSSEDKPAKLSRKTIVAAFNLFNPGISVIDAFYPELVGDQVSDFEGDSAPDPMELHLDQALEALPEGKYLPTSPAGALGIGNQGKPQILDGIPLRQEQDIRGYGFSDEFYSQYEGLDPKAFVTAGLVISRISKKASPGEYADQFTHFLKSAIGEVAASFIAAFKVTQRPLMSKVPGTGTIQLDLLEQQPLAAAYQIDVASRVRFLLSKLNDSDIQTSINEAWAQASVWNTSEHGGFTYEVFVRASAIDVDTLVLKYEFVVGTKGL